MNERDKKITAQNVAATTEGQLNVINSNNIPEYTREYKV